MMYRKMTIQQIRIAKGMTQTEVTMLSGIPLSTISGWERGERVPRSLTAFNKLLRFYGVELSFEALQRLCVALDCGTPASKIKFYVPSEEVERWLKNSTSESSGSANE